MYSRQPSLSPLQTPFLSSYQRSPSTSPVSRISNSSSRTSLLTKPSSQGRVIHYPPRISTQAPSIAPSFQEKFSLDADPATWAAHSTLIGPEPDDHLHEPRRNENINYRGTVFTLRGLANAGCLLLVTVALVALIGGYPAISYFTKHPLSNLGGFNAGGINRTGQIPSMSGNWGMIDAETPDSAKTFTSFNDGGQEYELIFSDEFNTDGRSFYPGDDPYWTAVDLHYWQTGNWEWYDPAAINTTDGALHLTLSTKPQHDLNYTGGMLSSWNQFCFTGGLVLAAVRLPGDTQNRGLWPALWAMGNLGRAGYGASLEGMWPYSYDTCDVGTVSHQAVNGQPVAATENGDPYADGAFSLLPGQKLSRCTCPGESHPGPMHEDGTYVGRSAPEIDVFEASVADNVGKVSQSAQWAPFNAGYHWYNTSEFQYIADQTITDHNNYEGGAYQMATSAVTNSNQDCYERGGTGCFAVYGFEYKPGYDGYISWISDGKLSWTLNAGAVGQDDAVEIKARPIPQEPMYLIANLGLSPSFGGLDVSILTFPSTMSIDWIRVYQPKGAKNFGCDPPDFPTQAYINTYMDAYTNPNYTTWQVDYGQPFPKNKWVTPC